MIKRWWNSRTARKFRQNRLAVVALFVISIYIALAFVLMLGGFISLETSDQRIGSQVLPGFLGTVLPQKRLDNALDFIDDVDRALNNRDPEQALGELTIGFRSVAKLPQPELRKLVDQGFEKYDHLAPILDELADSSQVTTGQLSDETATELTELEGIVDQLWPPPTGWQATKEGLALVFGTDRQGRSISMRAVYSVKVAIQVGVVTAFISVLIGSVLGTAAAFFGGVVDHVVTWLYTTFASIPNLVLLVLLAHMFTESQFENTLVPVYVAFCLTFWIGPCRVIRGETLKLKELEYIQAATAIGFSRPYIMVKHIIPNAAHLMLINFSLLFIGAIKSEVILSFLGLGVKRGPSWGIMIKQSGQEVVNGFFWQIGTATGFMFVLVLAFNILSDALQDVFDPKHV
ncbi:MAG: hypothetical protein CMJ78_01540 [Planctomycetaceae bacterium]|nr:hypothetical protein [Planctomycetaceae bacterium]